MSIFFLISIILTLAIYPLFMKNPWAFVAIQWMLRTEEFGSVLSMIMVIRQRKSPRKESNMENERFGKLI